MAKKEKPKPRLLRQAKLAKLLSDNIRKKCGKSEGELMLEAGYSKSYSITPGQVKKTKNWQTTMDKYLPEDLIARRHKQLLNKKETLIEEDVHGNKKIVRSKEIHVQSVAKGVEMGYRLRGRYQDKVALDIDSAKVDKMLDRLSKILPPMEDFTKIEEGEVVE